MRLAHKRKVRTKLHKQSFKWVATGLAQPQKKKPIKENLVTSLADKIALSEPSNYALNKKLTPKQQQILEIVMQNTVGMNSKSVGLIAGQEEAKAAAWAAGGLKKLLDEGLVEKQVLAGNKVIYKAL